MISQNIQAPEISRPTCEDEGKIVTFKGTITDIKETDTYARFVLKTSNEVDIFLFKDKNITLKNSMPVTVQAEIKTLDNIIAHKIELYDSPRLFDQDGK